MVGDIAVKKPLRGKMPIVITSHRFEYVWLIDVIRIGIHCFGVFIWETIGYFTDTIGIVEEIVVIKYPNNIAACHSDALVHCIVQSVVLFWNIMHGFAGLIELFFILFEQFQSSVGWTTINNNVFEIGIILPQNRIHYISQIMFPIQSWSYHRYFHHSCIYCSIFTAAKLRISFDLPKEWHCLIPTWDLSGFFEFQLISKVGCEKVKACKYPQPKVFGGYFRHAAAHRVKSCKGICRIGRREKVRYSFPYGRHCLPWPRKTCQKQHGNR